VHDTNVFICIVLYCIYSQGGKVPVPDVSGRHKSDANVDGDSEFVGKFTVWFSDFTRFDQQLHLLIDLNVFTDSDEQLLLLLKVRYTGILVVVVSVVSVVIVVVVVVVVAMLLTWLCYHCYCCDDPLSNSELNPYYIYYYN